MLVKDLLEITTGIAVIMHNNTIKTSFDFDVAKNSNLWIIERKYRELPTDLKELKVKKIYSECGMCVEVDFDINFYNKYKEFFKLQEYFDYKNNS